MNGAHLHLILNHVPALGMMCGLILLGLGLIRRNRELKSLALVGIILSALFTLPVNATGEEAEEIIEGLPGRSHELIHEHEEGAELALWLMLGVAAVAGGAWFMLRNEHPRAHLLTSITFGLGLLVFIWMIQVANLGGRISHPEVRPGFQLPVEPTSYPVQ